MKSNVGICEEGWSVQDSKHVSVLCLFGLFCLEHYNPSDSVWEVKLRNIYFSELKGVPSNKI